MNEHIIIYDAEYWADKGSMQRGWRSLEDHPPYLVQFSAIKVKTSDLSEVERISIYVKPVDEFGNRVHLTKYFEDLTHISEDTLNEKGILIPTAIDLIQKFVSDDPCYSYGRDDRIIAQSCYIWNQTMPLKAHLCKDVRRLLCKLGMSKADIAQNSSGTLAQFHNLEFTGHVHNAEDDCMSILTTLRHYMQQGKLTSDML